MKKQRFEYVEAIKITFRPLARGWYRCVQTGKKLRRGGIKAYRLAFGNRPRPSTPRVTVWAFKNEFSCPGCHKQHYHVGSRFTCICGKRMNIKHRKEKVDAYS